MPDKKQTTRLKKRAVFLSSTVAFVLAIAKVYVGLLIGSVAVLASALDSIFDFFTSIINVFAVVAATKPADNEHRFGHGKAEALASFFQAVLITLSALFLFFLSTKKLIANQVVAAPVAGYWVMAFSLLGTIIIVLFQNYTLKKVKSMVVSSDRLHYISDLLTNISVIIALVLQQVLNISWVDSVCGILIAAYLVQASLKILLTSVNVLMDRDVSDKYRPSIEKVLENFDQVFGFHDLRSRSAGDVSFLYFHVEMPKDISLEESHEIVERIMQELKQLHNELEIMVHADPVYYDSEGTMQLFDEKSPTFY